MNKKQSRVAVRILALLDCLELIPPLVFRSRLLTDSIISCCLMSPIALFLFFIWRKRVKAGGWRLLNWYIAHLPLVNEYKDKKKLRKEEDNNIEKHPIITLPLQSLSTPHYIRAQNVRMCWFVPMAKQKQCWSNHHVMHRNSQRFESIF